MGNTEFARLAKEIVADYNNRTKEDWVEPEEVFIVWICKVLQNNKALLGVDAADGMYYEVTWNGDKNEAYLDAYKKEVNMVIRPKEGE